VVVEEREVVKRNPRIVRTKPKLNLLGTGKNIVNHHLETIVILVQRTMNRQHRRSLELKLM
jgi:hypothetical protein